MKTQIVHVLKLQQMNPRRVAEVVGGILEGEVLLLSGPRDCEEEEKIKAKLSARELLERINKDQRK